MMDEESRYKIGPATKYAQDFVKRVKRPLTVDDLAHAFSAGKDFGRSTEWQRVDEVTPSPKYNGEQIAVLFEMSRNIYDKDTEVCPAVSSLDFRHVIRKLFCNFATVF